MSPLHRNLIIIASVTAALLTIGGLFSPSVTDDQRRPALTLSPPLSPQSSDVVDLPTPATNFPAFRRKQEPSALVTAVYQVLPLHPSCAATRHLESVVDVWGKASNAPDIAALRPPQRVPSKWLCYKHGGLNPGVDRSSSLTASLSHPWPPMPQQNALSGPALETVLPLDTAVFHGGGAAPHTTPPTQLVLRDAVVFKGSIYTPWVQAGASPIKVDVSGIFSMVSNNWPQSLVRSVVLHPLEALIEATAGNQNAVAAVVAALRRGSGPALRQQQSRIDFAVGGGSVAFFEYGYWQAPTDFAAAYHVAVEVALTMFHGLLRDAARSVDAPQNTGGVPLGTLWRYLAVRGVDVVDEITPEKAPFSVTALQPGPLARRRHSAVATSAPTRANYGLHPKSCAHGSAVCLNTPWAIMYAVLFAAGSGLVQVLAGPAAGPLQIPSLSSLSSTASVATLVRGLPPVTASAPKDAVTAALKSTPQPDDTSREVMVFDRLLVGYPPHCEPLWGPDAVLINLSIALDPHLALEPGRNRGVVSTPTLADADARDECGLLLWAYRCLMLRSARVLRPRIPTLVPQSPPPSLADAPLARTLPPLIIVSSRDGDWARQLQNEAAIIAALEQYLEQEFYVTGSRNGTRGSKCPALGSRGEPLPMAVVANQETEKISRTSACYVHRARFAGPLEEQIRLIGLSDAENLAASLEDVNASSRLDSSQQRRPVIFIGGHGANLLPSAFLPPNAGLISLDMSNTGFYPYGIVPPWLHWRRVVVDSVCNPRLRGGCGKKSTANNRDLRASEAQLQEIIAAVGDILRAQQQSPKLPSGSSTLHRDVWQEL